MPLLFFYVNIVSVIVITDALVGCLVPYKTVGYFSRAGKGEESTSVVAMTNARHFTGNCGETMARLLALTLLIGFFAFLPSAFADGENGLFCPPPFFLC